MLSFAPELFELPEEPLLLSFVPELFMLPEELLLLSFAPELFELPEEPPLWLCCCIFFTLSTSARFNCIKCFLCMAFWVSLGSLLIMISLLLCNLATSLIWAFHSSSSLLHLWLSSLAFLDMVPITECKIVIPGRSVYTIPVPSTKGIRRRKFCLLNHSPVIVTFLNPIPFFGIKKIRNADDCRTIPQDSSVDRPSISSQMASNKMLALANLDP